MENSNLLTKEQTCPGPRLCSSWEISEKELKAIKTEEDRKAWCDRWARSNPNPIDRDLKTWFHICNYCRRPRRFQLVECPSCHKFFKGPRPNFSVDYECEACE